MALMINDRWVIRKPYRRAGSPYWWAHIRDTRHDRVHWFNTQKKSEKGATQACIGRIKELEEREALRTGEKVVFEDAFVEFLKDRHVRDVTATSYEFDFKGVYAPHFGGKTLAEIARSDIRSFLEKHKQASARTRAKHVSMLRSFFSWAIDQDFISKNPAAKVRVERPEKRAGIALTPEEARDLLRATQEPEVRECRNERRGEWKQTFKPPEHLYRAVGIALLTGLRRRNILEMRWRHVDLAARRISFDASEMKGHADHAVPICTQLIALLGQPGEPDEPVLGEAVESFSTSFRAAVARAGLSRKPRFHDLRHSFASWIASICSFPCLRALLGHSPGASVTLVYTHPSEEEKLRAVEGLPKIIEI